MASTVVVNAVGTKSQRQCPRENNCWEHLTLFWESSPHLPGHMVKWAQNAVLKKKLWALRPQKPSRLIKDREVGGFGNFISNIYSLLSHHQNYSALRWAAVWAILVFHELNGQSHKTVPINDNFLFFLKEKGEPKQIEPRIFCLPA